MRFRNCDPARDREAARRIWREVGWLEKGKDEMMDDLLSIGHALVAEVSGEAECLVTSAPGVMRYLDEDLPLVEYTSVATSRVGRRQGLATRTMARTMAADVADGAIVARVCAFDQGFYNQVGFGAGGYEHLISFDPAALMVAVKPRLPRRLTVDDAPLLHASRLARRRGHGGVNYPSPAITRVDMRWADNGFGLGYSDGPGGALTHHFWCEADKPEHGPYHVNWMAYQSNEQLLELLGLLKGLSDQIALVRMQEPQGVQLQDLLDRPARHRRMTRRSDFENHMTAYAYWQVRICDLGQCLARTHLPAGEVRLNLRLTDPIAALLDDNAAWRGVGGEYVVTLGPTSSAHPGSDTSLSTLSASINAFSRLWLGVRPATGLAATDDLSGPQSLLEELDRVLLLPEPKPDWEF
jgi:predicted acetyltransferase